MRNFRRIPASLLLLFAVAALAWASDVWKTKPYQQWDRKDVTKILNDSPWVKTTTVTANWKSGDVMTSPEIVTGSPSMTAGGGMNGPAGLGIRPQEKMAKFEARWVSAETMREAMARLGVLDGKLTQANAASKLADSPTDYEISVGGADMTPFEGFAPPFLAKATYLEMKKSKQKLAPSDVEIVRSADGQKVILVTFKFPKTDDGKPSVAADEKEIEFVCKLKKATLRFHFDPRKMTDKSGSDL